MSRNTHLRVPPVAAQHPPLSQIGGIDLLLWTTPAAPACPYDPLPPPRHPPAPPPLPIFPPVAALAMDRPTGSSHAAFTMAALCAAGGVAGYHKTGSVPSLVAGLGIAALFGAGGSQINASWGGGPGNEQLASVGTAALNRPAQ